MQVRPLEIVLTFVVAAAAALSISDAVADARFRHAYVQAVTSLRQISARQATDYYVKAAQLAAPPIISSRPSEAPSRRAESGCPR